MKITVIPGYFGYAASENGGIWSRKISGSSRIGVKWKRLKGKDKKGYRWVALRQNGETHDWPVHQLILLTFVGPMPEGQETRHLDGSRNNNSLGNLCYGTRKRNAEDAVFHGVQPRGERHGGSKISEEQAKEIIRLRAEGVRGIELAERFGVSEGLISMILNGKIWTYLERPESYGPRNRRLKLCYSKITEDDVREVRKLWGKGWTQPDLSRKFGVAQSMISRIVNGKAWKHVK